MTIFGTKYTVYDRIFQTVNSDKVTFFTAKKLFSRLKSLIY